MSVRIRPAEITDAPALVDVHARAVEGLDGRHYSREMRQAWIDAVTREAMREGLQRAEATTAVADVSDELVGFSTLVGSDVEAVYVRPTVQGQGVGARLLRTLEAEARKQTIRSLTVRSSLNAVGFYESHGYEEVRTGTMELDETHDIQCVYMEKRLLPEHAA